MNDYSPTIIAGSLSKEELEKSIQEIVNAVDVGMDNVSQKFDTKLAAIEENFKKAGTKIGTAFKDSFNDALGGSFDQLAAAMEKISKASNVSTGGGSTGSGSSSSTSGSSGNVVANTIGELKEQIALQSKVVDEQVRGTRELQQEVDLHRELQKQLKEETTSTEQRNKSIASSRIQSAINRQNASLSESEKKLRLLEIYQRRYEKSTELSVQEQHRLADAIAKTKKQIDKLKPKTLSDVLGMDESSVDAIAKKMRALKSVQIDTKNAFQVNQLGNEYQRLSRLQAELLGKNIQLTHSNNYLAQSFGYIRNRIVYALTLGAVTNFIKEMYRVRSEYEILERSMGVLIDNFRRGSEIFNELNAMALKSPFTLVELGTAAKQLLAYNYAEDEVVETTRRLADISSALGVPMERLVYNLGQIRAQTVLTARDARDFANAGLAIVPMLAKMYTEQKKFGDEIVTIAQVYDMMSKKLVTYEDVMKVINQVTDEGGKFFDFQAKQAETLKVQLANLTLAWNNMLNDMGSGNKESLTTPIKLVKTLFQNWKDVLRIIQTIVAVYGAYKAQALLSAAANTTLVKSIQSLSLSSINLSKAWGILKAQWLSLSSIIAAHPIGAALTIMASAAVAWGIWGDKVKGATEWTERFGESGGKVVRDINNLYASLESVNQESSTYKKVLGELNQILGDYGLQQIGEKDSLDQIAASREKNIQLIKEEIIERERLNNINAGQEKYENKLKDIRANLVESLSDAITTSFGIGTVNQEIAKNAPAIATIIESIIEENIDLIADKSGEEFEKGQQKIWNKIQQALKSNKALGLSEETLNSVWQENDWIRWNSNIIENTIYAIREVKEEQNRWNRAIEEHAEIQKQDAQAGATFKDRVDQTSNSLMNAANDTEKFYQKINTLIKEYSGQNIIDFLVRVNSQVPAWMSKMGVNELTRLSAQFAAFAQNAEKSGLDKIDVNGKTFTKAELYERAAQYASALQTKTAEIEARQTSKLTSAASEALKDYKSSLEAVTIAKNKLKQGTSDSTLVTEKEAEAQKKYNAALKAGVSEKELLEAKYGKGTKKDVLGEALQKELQTIQDIQKLYKEYTKADIDSETAKTAAAKEYQKTLEQTNNTLSKFGIQGLTGEQIATMDLRTMRDTYQSFLDKVQSSPKAVEALEKAIRNLNIEITKEGQKTIIDSLNSKLSKLKDEYELAVELDANPELGENFATMFGIVPEALPHTIQEYAERTLDSLNNVLKKGKQSLQLPSLFLTPDDINILKELVQEEKLGEEYFKAIMAAYNNFVGALKSASTDVEKVISDHIKNYGDLSERLKEIENEKNENLKKLNAEYYTDELKQTEEYAKKRKIIIDKSNKDIAKATFDVLKMSDDYERFFTAINTLTKEDASEIKKRIKSVIIDVFKNGGLTVSQFRKELKAVEEQFEKLSEPATVFASYIQSGFDGAIKKAKEIGQELEVIGEKIKKDGVTAQDSNFLTSLGKVFDLNGKKVGFEGLFDYFGKNRDLQGLGNAVSKAGSNMADGANGFARAVAIIDTVIKNIHGAVEGVNQILNEINEGRNEDSKVGGWGWDAFSKVDQYAASGWEKLKSGNIMGAMTDTISSIIAPIVAIFRKADKDITDKIKKSELEVEKLGIAYDSLSDKADKAYGVLSSGARRAAIENKRLQLAEVQRQLQLEKSRAKKYQDEDKIVQLEGKVESLRREINNTTSDVINDMLGISSAGDGVTNLVQVMIDAFKQGEDAMDAFGDEWDKMIDNMILRLIISKYVQDTWDNIMKTLKNMEDEILGDVSERAAKAESEMIRIRNMSDEEFLNEFFSNNVFATGGDLSEFVKAQKDAMLASYKATWNEANSQLRKLSEQYTEESVEFLAGDAFDMMKAAVSGITDELKRRGKEFGEDAESKQLSNLQQGIQSLSEDTGNAIESYLNGISQQIYLHSSQLEEIKTLMQGFNFDVQLGVQSQILLELQNSYQVQMSIQNILQGVLTPSGRAFMVEME